MILRSDIIIVVGRPPRQLDEQLSAGNCVSTRESPKLKMKQILLALLCLLICSVIPGRAFVIPSTTSAHISGSTTPTPLWSEAAANLSASSSSDSSTNQSNKNNNYQTQKKRKLSRPERKALERQKKQQRKDLKKRQASKPKYNLHSNNVAQLTSESNAEEVVQAIKRAQNRHDNHDLRVISKFLIDECDEGFSYGYRGSLLARLAVAALHIGNTDCARRSIEVRRRDHRASMLPLEGAAIIRGLLRVHNVSDALEILDDELSLPMDVS